MIKARRRCQTCQSSRFQMTDSGYYVCENGHRVELSADIRADDTGNIQMGHQLKRTKKGTRESGDDSDRTSGDSPYVIRKLSVVQWVLLEQLVYLEELGFGAEIHENAKYLWSKWLHIHEIKRTDQSTAVLSELKLRSDIKLMDSLIICYLAALKCLYPITLVDLHEMARRMKLPYVNIVHNAPKELFASSIFTNSSALPTLEVIHERLWHMMKTFSDNEVTFPRLNWSLISYRYLKELNMSPLVHTITKRLATLTVEDFDFKHFITGSSCNVYHLPYVKLMILMTISISLYYNPGKHFCNPVDFHTWKQLIKSQYDQLIPYTSHDWRDRRGTVEFDSTLRKMRQTVLSDQNECHAMNQIFSPVTEKKLFSTPDSASHLNASGDIYSRYCEIVTSISLKYGLSPDEFHRRVQIVFEKSNININNAV